jgi:multiple sugar transport system substrate-binding protein
MSVRRTKEPRPAGKGRLRSLGASLLGAGLLITSAAGCGSSGGGAQSGGKVTLTVEDYYTADPANSAWNSLLAEYHRLHPNVTIKRTSITQAQYMPHVLDQAGAASLPNLLMIDNPYIPQVASTGTLESLNSLGKLDTSDFVSTELNAGKYKGQLYALPLYTNTTALFYNKKMFAAAHLSPPRTWAELEQDAKALTTKQHYGYITSLNPEGSWGEWILLPYLWSVAGLNALDHLTSPQATAALNVLVTMARNGSTPPAEVNWSQQETQDLFDAGKAAMEQNGPWTISTRNAVKGLDYGVVPLPVQNPGDHLYVPTGGETWAIPKSDPATEQAAFALLKWLAQQANVVRESVMQGGLVPTVRSAIPAALKQEDPVHMAAFATELQPGGTARAYTLHNPEQFSAIATTVGNAIDAAVIGSATAQQALANIAAGVAKADRP